MTIDTEYLALESLNENSSLSQRQLSKILGVSLGTVNTLLTKMQQEGLIKISSTSPCKFVYRLTSKGLAEKAGKTLKYVINNYKYINDTKERIKKYLGSLISSDDRFYFVTDDSDMSNMVLMAIDELRVSKRIEVIRAGGNIPDDGIILLISNQDNERYKGFRAECILEKI